jgi:nucleotidyltransferase/DNA polymerase involved in DNA repair
VYALVDGNNFYVSCERMFRPSLNGLPVVVLSNNGGFAIARSKEAKGSRFNLHQHGTVHDHRNTQPIFVKD